MSEGESKQVPSGGSDSKPESASSGPGMTSVSAPVTSAAPPEEEEEEESEDESEILEESPCGRWQKRREEVSTGGRFPGLDRWDVRGSPDRAGRGAGPGRPLVPPRRLSSFHLSPGRHGPQRRGSVRLPGRQGGGWPFTSCGTVCPWAWAHRGQSAACFFPCIFVLQALLYIRARCWCGAEWGASPALLILQIFCSGNKEEQ